MLPRLCLAVVLLCGFVLIGTAAAGAATNPAAAAAPATAEGVQITIDNFTFSPVQITAPVGARVSWTNRDDIPHTVTDAGDPRRFKSGALDTGDSFAVTFDKPGTYSYFCSLHPHMQGSILIR